MPKPTVEFENVECTAETDLAILCKFDDDQEIWVPKSQVDDDSEVYGDGHEGTLTVYQWWAQQKGLI